MSRQFQGTRFKYGLQVGPDNGSTALLSDLKYFAQALSPAQVAINTTAEQTFTVTGLEVGDVILSVNKPTAQAGLGIVGYRVSAANTLAITFANVTGAAITPTASEVYKVVVAKISA